MALWLIKNQYSEQVLTDLLAICGDPGLFLDPAEPTRIQYQQSVSSVGGTLLDALVKSPCFVGVRGESHSFSFGTDPADTLVSAGGITVYDEQSGTAVVVEIVYDVTNCNGNGRWVQGPAGNTIPQTPDSILFHELAHAFHLARGTFNAEDPEPQAVQMENEYRRVKGYPIRVAYVGGCMGSAPSPTTTTGSGASTGGTGGCFVATAAYGSPMSAEVEVLRRFRDEVVDATRAGRDFLTKYYSIYARVSPLVIRLMRAAPAVRDFLRISLTPTVQYLRWYFAMPQSGVETLPEPWQAFVRQIRHDFASWSSTVPLPSRFAQDGSGADPVKELEVVGRFLLRDGIVRAAYVERLRVAGELPIPLHACERERAASLLKAAGFTNGEIDAIVGTPSEAEK